MKFPTRTLIFASAVVLSFVLFTNQASASQEVEDSSEALDVIDPKFTEAVEQATTENTPLNSLLCKSGERWFHLFQKCKKSKTYRGFHKRRFWTSCETGERWSRREKKCIPISKPAETEDKEVDSTTSAFERAGLSCDNGGRWSRRLQKCTPGSNLNALPNQNEQDEDDQTTISESSCNIGERWSHYRRKCIRTKFSRRNKQDDKITPIGRSMSISLCEAGEKWSRRFHKCLPLLSDDKTTTNTFEEAGLSCDNGEKWSRRFRNCVLIQNTNREDDDESSTTLLAELDDKPSCKSEERWSRYRQRCLKTRRSYYARNEGKFQSRCETGQRWSRYMRRCVEIGVQKPVDNIDSDEFEIGDA